MSSHSILILAGMGLGAVFVASIGSAFLPPTTALGAGLYSLRYWELYDLPA